MDYDEENQPFIEQKIKNDEKKTVQVGLSIGHDRVFTEEFIKFFRANCVRCLADEMRKCLKVHPNDYDKPEIVDDMVKKAQMSVLLRVGPGVLEVLRYLMKRVAKPENGNPGFVEDAFKILFEEDNYDVQG